jgi:hypothetical protein
MTNR